MTKHTDDTLKRAIVQMFKDAHPGNPVLFEYRHHWYIRSRYRGFLGLMQTTLLQGDSLEDLHEKLLIMRGGSSKLANAGEEI